MKENVPLLFRINSMGFDHIASPPLLPVLWFFLYVFSCGTSFLVGFRFFFSFSKGSSADCCDFGVLMGGGKLKVFPCYLGCSLVFL